ncbi:membrane protein insertase YidC [Flexivirga alba]|uniref:Membrane protein insertase YidC n=1 Tax=Flexivirga alba TaxID=702742 RepID=A0ABW2AD32_9MICO
MKDCAIYNFFDTILYPLEWFVAFVMVGFHKILTAIGMPAANGWTWALSVVGLVLVLRIMLIPLFVKQIKSSRRMQLIQPEIQKIQKKYKGKKDAESRQKMTEETMELYKKAGTNPFSSCMPMLLQSPFFFALFRVLDRLKDIGSGHHDPIGWMTQPLAKQAEQSKLFGAQLSSAFLHPGDSPVAAVRTLCVALIIIMSVTVFTTQHQLMRKNMPASALDNPMAKQQKYIMYIMPVFFAISGVNFPIGVLLYWVTTNLWTMGQQFYTIRRMPAPGSEAEKALEQRRAAKGKPITKLSIPGLHKSDDEESEDASVELAKSKTPPGSPGLVTADGGTAGKSGGQRVQPKRSNNKKRKR